MISNSRAGVIVILQVNYFKIQFYHSIDYRVLDLQAYHVFITDSHHRLMMTSSNGNIFRVTGHLCVEFTGPRWIPRTKASDTVLWCFLWSASELTVEETIVRLVIRDAIAPIMTSP